jgi:hypothetical protein
VVAATAGRDFDSNGYVVTVSLDGYSDNCRLSVGPGSVDVQLSVGELTRDVRRVAFEITCQDTTGDMRLTTTTGGQHQ